LKRVEERALAGLERQRGTLQRRIAVFEGLAKEGALAASESIAALEAQEAELVQRQEQLKRRAQRREFALAAVKTYVQLLERGAPNALAQTIRDITLLTQLISKLPTFYQGTEYVREGVRIPNVVRDALIVRVHEGERIVPAHINKQLRGVKNEDLPKLVAGGEVSFDYDRFLDTLDVVLSKRNSVKRVRRRL
jgi:ribosomal protein S19